jgi:diamine N-acetyltransferase
MIDNFEIRPASINDRDLIIEIGRQTQLETFLKDNKPEVMYAYLEETFGKEIIENELLDTNSAYFISERDGIPVGYIKLRFDNFAENELAGPNSAELQRIYILASQKGNGFGKLQLEFSYNYLKEKGYEIIWLGVWEKNFYAQEFYKKNGFERFGEHPFWFGGELQNDYLMKRFI